MRLRTIMVCLIFLVALLALSVSAFGYADGSKSITLVGWGIDEKYPNKFIVDAKNVGFDELITWSTDPVFLKKAVEIGKSNSITTVRLFDLKNVVTFLIILGYKQK